MHPNARLGDEIDASLFQDDDGSVYFLWHSGKIAKLKPDMSDFAEPYHWLRSSVSDADPHHHSGLCAGIFGKDSFDHIGFEGVFIFKANGRYYLDCSEAYDGRYSCMVPTSSSPSNALAMQMAFWFHLHFASTFLKVLKNAFLVSRSFSTVLLPFLWTSSSRSTTTVAN